MARLLRMALMWLLAVAVPAQALSAASMAGCGPAHHDALAVHAQGVGALGTPGELSQAHREEATAHAHGESLGVADHRHHHADAESKVKLEKATVKIAKGSCSACASCCMAAALPTTVVSFQPARPAEFFLALAPSSVSPFLTDGPERPPRHPLV